MTRKDVMQTMQTTQTTQTPEPREAPGDPARTPRGADRQAVVLFGHGARDARWARPFEHIRGRLRAAMPHRAVELAYLEFMTPDLPTAIDRLAADGATRIVLMPLFLGAGGHVLRDLPALLETARARHPGLAIEALPALGEHEAVLDAIAEGCLTLIEPGR